MRAWLALLLLPLAAAAQSPGSNDGYGSRDRRGEAKVALPQYPNPENYLPFEVSATTPFNFFVDAKSVSVGPDQVVRYTMIAKSSEGALNISFEGMNCVEHQVRVYALGSANGTWFEPRNSRWEAIRGDTRNAQRLVLYNDFFCPLTAYVANAAEAVRVLRSGGNRRAFTGGN